MGLNPSAKSIDSCHPARTAQDDMSRNFLLRKKKKKKKNAEYAC